MKTELTEIQDQLRVYLYSNNQDEIDNAEVYLRGVHKRYGTVDVKQIKNRLINMILLIDSKSFLFITINLKSKIYKWIVGKRRNF